MANWYSKVVEDIANLGGFLDYYTVEYDNARSELIVRGTIENLSKQLPPIVEQRLANCRR